MHAAYNMDLRDKDAALSPLRTPVTIAKPLGALFAALTILAVCNGAGAAVLGRAV